VTDVLDVLAPAATFAGDELLVVLPASQGPAPDRRALPNGPVIEDAAGERAQNRTYQDLLANERDEAAFEHYATGQLAWASSAAAGAKPFGPTGMFSDVSMSPDGSLLLVERVRRPFSYVVPFERFGRVVEVWDRSGKVVATIADQEPAETIPIDGVRTGPRQVEWLATEPATLVWFEALDDGDPRKKVPHRDKLLRAEAPFTAPIEVMKLEHRARDISALDDGKRALVREYDRDRRWTTTWLGDVRPGGTPTKLFDRSSLDAYGDPGSPVMRTLASGHSVIASEGGAIFLRGAGATPQGDRPFLDRMVIDTKATTRIVASTDDTEVDFVGFAGPVGSASVVVRRQSQDVAPNLHVTGGGTDRVLTTWPEPHPSMRGVTRKLLKYRREDGVELSGTLYVPAGSPPPGGWPLLVWAYPIEFNDRDTAGQVRAATNEYPRVTASSPLALLAAGYAVLDDAAMPVVGDPETMNDTLLEQLEDAAKAAIDAAAATGSIDRTRVAVGGHSYGAFMTANLLAHTELFRAGIARSGAYNRTLTPFGYQSERRTLWEAPQTYAKVSPLLHADKIDEPILLIHGELDDNSGTFPLQSQRLFSAIRGSGGVARLVMLPGEAHGYTARENLLHMLAEEIDWLDTHVRKPAG
jgi:dipeptidyl aminopeptidase/acylaminoacyl peptidase